MSILYVLVVHCMHKVIGVGAGAGACARVGVRACVRVCASGVASHSGGP